SRPSVIIGDLLVSGKGRRPGMKKSEAPTSGTSGRGAIVMLPTGTGSVRFRADGERVIELCGGPGRQVAVLRGGAAHCGGERPLRGPVVPVGDRLHQGVILEE